MSKVLPRMPLKLAVRPIERLEVPEVDKIYRQVGVKLWGEGAYERETITGSQTKYSVLSQVKTNDIIVNKIWARNGSVAVISSNLDGCYVSGEFPTFEPIEGKLHPRWFHWLTKTHDFWEQCDEQSRGTSGKNRIRPEKFLEVQIPLPPLDEQRRIVARIEELAAKIEEARGLRREAEETSNMLLEKAFNKIREEMLKSSFPKDKIGNVTTITSGGTPSRTALSYWNGDIPWIKTGELLDADIYQAEEHISAEGLENSSAKLFPADTILVALYGQGQTRGRTGRLMIEAATNQACCAILPQKDILEPRFVQYWLRSLYTQMRENAFGGAQPNWNGQTIKNIEIALPPLDEQRRIVAHLDALQAQIDRLKREQAEAAAELDKLLPSILDKAFKGEL